MPPRADYQAQQGLANNPRINNGAGEVVQPRADPTRRALHKENVHRLHNDAVYLPISYVSMMVVAKPELGEIPYAPIASDIPFEQITPVKP